MKPKIPETNLILDKKPDLDKSMPKENTENMMKKEKFISIGSHKKNNLSEMHKQS